jgi:hypothetical protein
MSTKSKRQVAALRRPEKKYGPFHGGVGIAVWLNEVQTDSGPKFIRTIQIAPRRYRSKKSGDWEDSSSLRVTDIPSLVLGLAAAHQFCLTTPLPGQPAEEEHVEETVAQDGNGTPPF